jgi:hypothetical protein
MYYYYYYYYDQKELPTRLRLNIRIGYELSVTSSVVSGILDVCEEVAFEIVRDDINYIITNVFGSLSEEDQEFVDKEVDKYKYDALLITDSYSGSIIIEAELSYVAMIAVLAVLEISFKESWKETQVHNKIKNILTSRVGLNGKKFISGVKDKLITNKKLEYKSIEPTFDPNRSDDSDVVHLSFEDRKNLRDSMPPLIDE